MTLDIIQAAAVVMFFVVWGLAGDAALARHRGRGEWGNRNGEWGMDRDA